MQQRWAWIADLVWLPLTCVEWAPRIEGSHELEDAPRWRGGIAMNIHSIDTMNLTLDWLYDHYARGLAEISASARQTPRITSAHY